MAFDLAALAESGATVIVGAMATDLWQEVRTRLGRLFGRNGQSAEGVALAELDEARTTLEAATMAASLHTAASATGGSTIIQAGGSANLLQVTLPAMLVANTFSLPAANTAFIDRDA